MVGIQNRPSDENPSGNSSPPNRNYRRGYRSRVFRPRPQDGGEEQEVRMFQLSVPTLFGNPKALGLKHPKYNEGATQGMRVSNDDRSINPVI